MREKLYVSLHLIFLIHLALEGNMCNHPKGGPPNKGTKKLWSIRVKILPTWYKEGYDIQVLDDKEMAFQLFKLGL